MKARAQENCIGGMLDAAGRLARQHDLKQLHLHTRGASKVFILGPRPDGKPTVDHHVFHFKNEAARRKAQVALDAAKAEGGDLTQEQIEGLVGDHVHPVPIYRGMDARLVIELTKAAAKEQAQQKEVDDVPKTVQK